MNLCILIALLSLLVVINFYFFKKNLVNPSLLCCLGYLFGTVICLLNLNNWNDIQFGTCFVIFLTCSLITFGSVLSALLFRNKKKEQIDNPNIKIIDINKMFFLCAPFFVLMLVTAIWYFKYDYDIAVLAGYKGGISHFFSYVRNAIADDTLPTKMNIVLNILLKISKGFSYALTFYLVSYVFYYKNVKEHPWKFALCAGVIVLYFIHMLLSGGRTQFMYYILYLVILIIALFYKRRNGSLHSGKVILFGSAALITVLVVFLIIENTTRGSVYGNEYSAFYKISQYAGSSIKALDVYLYNPTFISDFSEGETFASLYSILDKIGLSTGINYRMAGLEYICFGNSELMITNIFGSLRRYIHDYGYVGCFLIQFILGFIFGALYNKAFENREAGIWVVCYGVLVYPLLFSYVEERFFLNVLTLSTAIELFLIICIYYLIKYFFCKKSVFVMDYSCKFASVDV